MIKKLFRYPVYCAVLMIAVLNSCKKDSALDVVPRDRFSDATVWTDKGATDLFLNDIYLQLPNGNTWYDPFDNWSDNSICGFPWPSSRNSAQQAVYTPSTLTFGDLGNVFDWSSRYANIRKCNIFIEKVTESTLDEDFKKMRLAEVRFLRAYYYHQLWMSYGGVPIITDVLNRAEQGDEVFRSRNTADETFKFITDECAAAFEDLSISPEAGRASKGAALALKGWCELFAHKYAESAETNKRIIDSLGYDLHPDYAAFFLSIGNASKESIFFRAYIPRVRGGNIDGTIGPTFTKGGAETSWGGQCPTQELVDDYAMDNGKIISDPSSGYNPQTPYKNREKRFYESIVYDNSFWYDDTIYTRQGVGSKNEIDLADKDDATQTGYYVRKRISDKITLGSDNWDGYSSPQNYSYFRYGEILLNYAEAQNEASGPDASVYDAITKIRERGGLPALPAGLSQDDMRTSIRRERRIELAFEDKRWWDLIRWNIAHINLNKPLHGISIKIVGGVLTYAPVAAVGGDRKFDATKNYLFPVPQAMLDQNKNLTQNPGYQ
jgi:starch-binding outer membrane protein, SusD/RagB family